MEDPNSWMVYFMENPMKMDDDWGYPYDETESSIFADGYWDDLEMILVVSQ